MLKPVASGHFGPSVLFSHVSIDAILAFVMGLALFFCAGVDTRTYFAHIGKPRFTFAFNALSGGIVMTPELELFRSSEGEYAVVENFTQLVRDGVHTFRNALGPVSKVTCVTQRPTAQLNFQLVNDIPDQELTIACDGAIVERLSHLSPGLIVRSYLLNLRPGSNQITFTFLRYNHDGSHEAADPRHIAGVFRSFDLTLQ